MKLLALDASSSMIGYTIFDIETKLIIEMNYLKLDTSTSLIERAMKFSEVLTNLKEVYLDLTELVIEEAFMALGTTSNAQTVTTLLQINAMYQLVGHYAGLKVSLISVRASRKSTFPGVQLRKISTFLKIKEKEYCFKLATETLLKHIKLPTKVMSKGPRKGMTVYEDYAFDMVDSFIVGYGFLCLNQAK